MPTDPCVHDERRSIHALQMKRQGPLRVFFALFRDRLVQLEHQAPRRACAAFFQPADPLPHASGQFLPTHVCGRNRIALREKSLQPRDVQIGCRVFLADRRIEILACQGGPALRIEHPPEEIFHDRPRLMLERVHARTRDRRHSPHQRSDPFRRPFVAQPRLPEPAEIAGSANAVLRNHRNEPLLGQKTADQCVAPP